MKNIKLNKKPANKNHPIKLENYLATNLTPKKAINWAKPVTANWGMMGNDTIGDCTCAAYAHAIQVWSANSAQEVTVPDNDIIALYSAITGYVPGNESTDNGAVEVDVLNFVEQNGLDGHKISTFAAVNVADKNHVKLAIEIFGGVYIGLALPISAQNQKTWSVPRTGTKNGNGVPGSWGGHAVYAVAYDSKYVTVVTWGQLKKMTWGFWSAYCDEAYALISNDWLNKSGTTPEGLNLAQLNSDISILKG